MGKLFCLNFYKKTDILQDLIENYPQPVESQKDTYTFYSGYTLWLVFPLVATISELITSVLNRLLEQPKLIDELINKQNEVFGNLAFVDDIKNHLTSVESIRKIVELDSVCRESFRANNDITVSDRTNSGSNNDILDNGVIIPPGQHILLNGWVNNYDSKVQKGTLGSYNKFEPFRHLETQLTTTKTGKDCMLFGIEKHVCPARCESIDDLTQISHSSIRKDCIRRKKMDRRNLHNPRHDKLVSIIVLPTTLTILTYRTFIKE